MADMGLAHAQHLELKKIDQLCYLKSIDHVGPISYN